MSSVQDSCDRLHLTVKLSEVLETDWEQVALELSIRSGKRFPEDAVKTGGGMPPRKGERKMAPRKIKPKAGAGIEGAGDDEAEEERLATGLWPKRKGKGRAERRGELRPRREKSWRRGTLSSGTARTRSAPRTERKASTLAEMSRMTLIGL
ncbi:hypothetical protein PZA11_002717 [Diplocarpon coronariae]